VKTVLALSFFLALAGSIFAADLDSIGDWSETLTAADLTAGAGTDLPDTLESISAVTTLNISNAAGPWRLKVRRAGVPWDDGVTLWVKRISNGSGSGTIAGGSGYVAVPTSAVELFTGSENRSNIALQFKLTGLRRNLPPRSYLSSLTFTVQ